MLKWFILDNFARDIDFYQVGLELVITLKNMNPRMHSKTGLSVHSQSDLAPLIMSYNTFVQRAGMQFRVLCDLGD